MQAEIASIPEVRQLGDDSLKSFDRELVEPYMWDQLKLWVPRTFGDREFRFLDVGGGNGMFADSLLKMFPNAQGTVLDNGEVLLRQNRPHPRKTTVLESATRLVERLGRGRYDLVSMNWLLHHLVTETYAGTRALQSRVLREAAGLLSPGGRVLVMENLYEGTVFRTFPGRLVYELTSSRVLAPVTRRLGANTAGCGLCCLHHTQWQRTFKRCGLGISDVLISRPWKLSLLRRTVLLLGTIRSVLYWLQPA